MTPRNDGSYDLVEGEYQGVKLTAPRDFWSLSAEEIKKRGYG